MGFELTPRERRWFDAILVLGAFALAFIVLGFVGAIFAIFGDLIMVFFLAWLLAFMLGPVVNRVTAIPFMSRTGADLHRLLPALRRARRRDDPRGGRARQLDQRLHRQPAVAAGEPARRSSRRGRSG